ncbi:hypothetical protein X551_04106 [Methylibium sp. T29]|nr:hypothetical protein X551_04106 [Methylibium sp. T29]
MVSVLRLRQRGDGLLDLGADHRRDFFQARAPAVLRRRDRSDGEFHHAGDLLGVCVLAIRRSGDRLHGLIDHRLDHRHVAVLAVLRRWPIVKSLHSILHVVREVSKLLFQLAFKSINALLQRLYGIADCFAHSFAKRLGIKH